MTPIMVIKNHSQLTGCSEAATSVPTETEIKDMEKDQGLVATKYFINREGKIR